MQMKSTVTLRLVLLALVSESPIVATLRPLGCPLAHGAMYCDVAQPIASRVAALLPLLTPEELIAQTFLRYPCASGGPSCMVSALSLTGFDLNFTGVGYVSIRVVTNRTRATPLENLRLRNALSEALVASSRLHIPPSWSQEGLHSGAWGGTLFPGPAGMGSSWDAPLVEAIAAAIATESRAVGVDTVFGPELNMFDARSGRFSEGFGDDHTLAAILGAAFVRGLQGGGRSSTTTPTASTYLPSINASVIALAKHFCAYGADGGGLNSGVTEVSNRTLFERYLKPWRVCAAAGLRGVMVAHSTTGGVPNHAHVFLLRDTLRRALGFGDGLILTDDNNIAPLVAWGVAANASHAAARALRAGIDLDLQGGSNATFLGYTALPDALASGLVSLEQLREAASRVLTSKFASGLMDAPTSTPEAALDTLQSDAHVHLAQVAAVESLVLLINKASTLPLRVGTLRSVAISGALAACASGGVHIADPDPAGCPARLALLGPYTLWNGSSTLVPTIAEAAVTTLGAARVTYSVGGGPDDAASDAAAIAAAAAAAAAADVAIIVLGDSMATAKEGSDRDSLDLPGSQLPLLSAVSEACAHVGVPLILILLPGRPATFGPDNALLSGVSSLLVAWHPGQAGAHAIIDVLLGAASPSGKLSAAWPRSVGQIGSGASPWSGAHRNGDWLAMRDDVTHDTRGCDASGVCYSAYISGPATPLFVLGAGMTYTTFSYNNVTAVVVRPPQGCASPSTRIISVNLTLTNMGNASGVEIVFAFIHDPLGVSLFVRPWKRLAAFTRSPLLAQGERVVVSLDVSVDALASWDDDGRLRVLPGLYTLSVGADASSDVLRVGVSVSEEDAAAGDACLSAVYAL